jgi:hypothetical protein
MLKIQNHEEDDLRVVYYADLERRMDEHTLAGLLKFVLEVQNMQGVPRQGLQRKLTALGRSSEAGGQALLAAPHALNWSLPAE